MTNNRNILLENFLLTFAYDFTNKLDNGLYVFRVSHTAELAKIKKEIKKMKKENLTICFFYEKVFYVSFYLSSIIGWGPPRVARAIRRCRKKRHNLSPTIDSQATSIKINNNERERESDLNCFKIVN